MMNTLDQEFVSRFPVVLQPFVVAGLIFRSVMTPIGEPLHALLTPIYQTLYKLGASIGLKEDQTLFVLLLFSTYPLGLLYRLSMFNNSKVPKKLKELYLLGIGLFICFFVFGYSGWHAVVSAGISWLIMRIGGRGASRFVFFWAWGYLSVTHLIRMTTDYAGVQVDYSALLMMMTLRIVSIAFNYADWPIRDQQDPVVANKAVKDFPDLISYFSFNFYFPSLLAGPAFDYKYFDDFLQDYHVSETKDRVEVWPNIVAVAYNFVMMFISFAVFTQIDKYPRELIMYEKETFAAMTFVRKMLFIQIMVTLFKFRYYMVWYIAQGACLLTGFGYEPKTKHWNGSMQTNLLGYEFATSPYWLAANWNISVHHWLKNYAYLRNKRKGQAPSTRQVFESFMASAAWHGFYPGYYIFFFFCGIGVDLGRRARNIFRHHFYRTEADYRHGVQGWALLKRPEIMLYNLVGWAFTVLGTNYIGSVFICLGVQEALFLFKETYACFAVVAVVAWLVALVVEPIIGYKKKTPRKGVQPVAPEVLKKK